MCVSADFVCFRSHESDGFREVGEGEFCGSQDSLVNAKCEITRDAHRPAMVDNGCCMGGLSHIG